MRSPFPAKVTAALFWTVLFPDPAFSSSTGNALSGDVPVELLQVNTFRHAHPDLAGRHDGASHLARGDFSRARVSFERGAYYADKASQAAMAEMLWLGRGGARDRAQAYVWMDLAAERGYPVFLGQRESMWAALTDAERELALTIGDELYSRYGDDVAKPRQERVMRRARTQLIGSRVGADVNPSRTIMNGFPVVGKVSGSTLTDADLARINTTQQVRKFFAAEYWTASHWWQRQDAHWNAVSVGEVIVRPLINDPAQSED